MERLRLRRAGSARRGGRGPRVSGEWRRWVGLAMLVGLLGGGLTVGFAGQGAPAATAKPPPVGLDIPVDVGRNDSANLTGAGATFPAPLYQAWFDDYRHLVAKGVQVNYQSLGSGAGVQQFNARTVAFGASDVGMTDEQLAVLGREKVQLLPTVIGAVVLTYNLDGLSVPLNLDGPVLAAIFLGDIRKWDDPAIAALNPGVKLPGDTIQVVHRSDSSGTSGVFTDYLSKVSAKWEAAVGRSTAPNWPVGQGGKGNDGVTGIVKNTPNAIGYVELNYAIPNHLPFALMKNQAGKFVLPSAGSASAAADGVTLPEDYRVSITNSTGESAYPIASFTYLLLYKTDGACTQQRPLADLLWWAYHDTNAQGAVEELDYAPLPASLLGRVEATLEGLRCDNGSEPSLRTAP